MASLSLKHIYKVYDGNVKAVNDFNMEIEDKEFIVFVGPSGCGKSTTLRMIAGLEEISAGELMIDGEVVNDVEPKDRNIAMVFQNYALYPHMTVRENMEFALKLKKLPKDVIEEKVNEAARILDITQYLDRKPRALSGGQRQRVSLGRAIVRSPKVFLLDEPLSNLDAKLRAQMRTEISKLHDKLQTTFIYVTHDQVEAMTMGTRIVVMKLGFVQQIDTPQNLYNYPGNLFVAGFIGTPQMNFFEATLNRVGNKVEITFANDRKILVPAKHFAKAKASYFDGETPVIMGIRPEDIHIEESFVADNPECVLETDVSIVEDLGSESIVFCELDPEADGTLSETKTRMTLKVDPRTKVYKGDKIKVAFDASRIHLFDKETEVTILPRIPENNEIKGVVRDGVLSILGKSIALPKALNLENGEYDLTIPTDAFLFDGVENESIVYPETIDAPIYDTRLEAKRMPLCSKTSFAPYNGVAIGERISLNIVNSELIGKTILLELEGNGENIFAIAPQEINSQGATVSIDLKKVTFSRYGEVIVNPLPAKNILSAHLLSEKASKKAYNYILAIEDANFQATSVISEKLITAAGRKAFSVNLAVDFTPYGVEQANDGLKAVVDSVLDYGAERFAVLSIGEKKVNMFLSEGQDLSVGEEIHIAINPYALGIVDSDRDIRII